MIRSLFKMIVNIAFYILIHHTYVWSPFPHLGKVKRFVFAYNFYSEYN